MSSEQWTEFRRQMAKWDEYAQIKWAEEKGEEKGRTEGIEIGIEKGEEKKAIQVIQSLLAKNKLNVTEIAECAGVTENFVRQVKNKMN